VEVRDVDPGVLTPGVATAVVRQVIARLGVNVNIMDADGVILASGDPSRIGDVHEGARRVLREGGTVAVTAAEAERLAGTLPGVNSPISLDGQVVGVVGLTGDPERLATAAASVVLTVELLLAQEQSAEERQWRARARTQLVEDLAAGRMGAGDWDRRCRLVGARLLPPYALLATRLSAAPSPVQQRRQLDLGTTGALVALDVGDVVWVLAGEGHHRTVRSRWETARAALRRTGAEGPTVDAGVAADLTELAELVRRTRLALHGAVPGDCDLRDLELPVLLAELDHHVARDAVGRLVAGLDGELRRTVAALLDADLVVTRAAAALNVHRNTMLGRLDRTARITGRDPRRFRDAAALHVGLLLEAERGRRGGGTGPAAPASAAPGARGPD
jgi:carbohydrate diacid regulator